MSSRVVVLGDVMLDVIVRPKVALARTSDTPSDIRVVRGGSGASLAIAIAATGHDVTYVGAAGADAAREVVAHALERARVSTSLELVDAPTGTVVSLVSGNGQRLMLTDRSANSLLSDTFVENQLADAFDHLHVSGYLLLDAETRGVANRALSLAQRLGRTTSVDVCSIGPLHEVSPEVFLRASTFASELFANEEEALALTTTSDAEDAMDVLTQLFDEVVITRGARGALAGIGDERFHVGAREVDVVDTTGAGDAATGTYLGARLHGEAPTAALSSGMDAAARIVGGLGPG